MKKPDRRSFRDLTGLRSGKITVLDFAGYKNTGKGKHPYWWCSCNCGNPKYFKIVTQSLVKGITKSCGCLYKNNGNSKAESIKTASKKTQDYTFTKFNGWNHPCECYCNTCKTEYSFDKAYTARHSMCCSKEDNHYLNKLDYEPVGDDKIKCINCQTISDKPKQISSLAKCPCTLGIDDPYSIYILEDKLSGQCKIGKSNHKDERYKSVIASANNSGHNFELVMVYYVKGEKSAYYLESLLHRHYSDYRIRLDFSGGTEVFTIPSKEVIHYIENDLSGLLKKLEVGEIPINIYNPYTYTGIEHEGIWYPSKAYFSRYHGIDISNTDEVLSFTSIKWYKIWKPLKQKYSQEKRSELAYGKDWGDGLFGTIHGLARKYGHCDGAIWHRVNKLNYSMKDALELPKDNTDKYWYINNKHYLKSEICNILGINKHTVVQRIKRGIPVKYAITPDRFVNCQYRNKIFNLNGEVLWWGDLKAVFGENRAIGNILHTYTTVGNWLIQEDLLSDNDYFEEIDL